MDRDDQRDQISVEARLFGSPQTDMVELGRVAAEIRAAQSLLGALLGGLIGAAVGAFVWAAITVTTNHQVGIMAMGVGFLTGVLVRALGRGVNPVYGVVGAFFALLGCFAGSLLSGAAIVGAAQGESMLSIVADLSVERSLAILGTTYQRIDALFYAIALYEGYRLAFRRISSAELAVLGLAEPAPSRRAA